MTIRHTFASLVFLSPTFSFTTSIFPLFFPRPPSPSITSTLYAFSLFLLLSLYPQNPYSPLRLSPINWNKYTLQICSFPLLFSMQDGKSLFCECTGLRATWVTCSPNPRVHAPTNWGCSEHTTHAHTTTHTHPPQYPSTWSWLSVIIPLVCTEGNSTRTHAVQCRKKSIHTP